MADEREIKRYEPLGFLLALGLFSMLSVMAYALYKLHRNLLTGQVAAPEPGGRVYAGAVLLLLAFGFLVLGSRFFRAQEFPAFRTCLGASFAGSVLFVVFQVAGIPLRGAGADPVQLGYYYLAFLSGVQMLFVLIGLVGTAVLLARAYRAQAYVESFIFSVNPPNILNLKLLLRYMGFVTILWVGVIVFLKIHAV